MVEKATAEHMLLIVVANIDRESYIMTGDSKANGRAYAFLSCLSANFLRVSVPAASIYTRYAEMYEEHL